MTEHLRGRVSVRLQPGDTIPNDVTIVDAFRNHAVYNAVFITVEADWLPLDVSGGIDWYYLRTTTMRELHELRWRAAVPEVEAIARGQVIE